MRGPGVRLNYDVRRLWRCPQCGYERRAPASEVGVRCHCSKDEPRMKLVEGQRRNRPLPTPLDLYVELEQLPADDPTIAVEQTVATEPSVEETTLSTPISDDFGEGIDPKESSETEPPTIDE